MNTDPQARSEAHSALTSMFRGLGQGGGVGSGPAAGGALGGMAGQLTEFLEMPVELAQIILNYAVQLSDLTLKTLEEGGIVLVKGMTPA